MTEKKTIKIQLSGLYGRFGINNVYCPKCGKAMIKDMFGVYSCWNCNMARNHFLNYL